MSYFQKMAKIEMQDRVDRVRALQSGEMKEHSLKIRNEHMGAIEKYRDEILRHKVTIDAHKDSLEIRLAEQEKHRDSIGEMEKQMKLWRSDHEKMQVQRKSKHIEMIYEAEQAWSKQHQDLRRGHEDTLAQYEAKESRAMANWRSQHENASSAQIKASR